jgi:3-oxoacyl-[acyl-carrier-protein] synthase-1
MRGLDGDLDFSSDVATTNWTVPPKADFLPRAIRWAERFVTARETLIYHLGLAFDEARAEADLKGESRVGIILASTKGLTEDFVWDQSAHPPRDPLTPLLDEMISRIGFQFRDRICVSNACASSLAALALAKTWIQAGRVDDVIVLACDSIDSFVLHGFHQLRVLTSDRTRPFSGDRSGFLLGDGAACLILSNRIPAEVSLIDARFDSEGYAVTRPSLSGESLLRACRMAGAGKRKIDLVVAHGTATLANDETEDRVFTALFEKDRPLVTGTKWLVGHTLGTSGLIDVISARASLRRQKGFLLKTTPRVDESFRGGNYLAQSAVVKASRLETALVTSRGFGGVPAAALIGFSDAQGGDKS